MWPELIQILVDISSSNNTSQSRLGALTTLGFICEDMAINVFATDQVSNIFGALLDNFNTEDLELQRIAIRAFQRSSIHAPELLNSD